MMDTEFRCFVRKPPHHSPCRFVDIAACHYNHISAAVNHSGKVYMWGQCRNQSIQTPTETKFAHVVDVFACFATPSVTPYPMSVEHSRLGSLNQVSIGLLDQIFHFLTNLKNVRVTFLTAIISSIP